MTKRLLAVAVMAGMLGSVLPLQAEDQPQPDASRQQETAKMDGKDATTGTMQDLSCPAAKQETSGAQGDPDAPQNHVEYGGGA